MFCEQCGNKLAENEVFCPKCGAYNGEEPQSAPAAQPAPAPAAAPEPVSAPEPIPAAQPVPTPDVPPAPIPAAQPTPTPDVPPAPIPAAQPSPTPDVPPAPIPSVQPTPEPKSAPPKPAVAAFADAKEKVLQAGKSVTGGKADQKTLIILAAAAVAFIVVVIIIISVIIGLLSGSPYKLIPEPASYIYADGKYTFFNGTNKIKEIEGNCDIYTNCLGTTFAVSSDDAMYMVRGGDMKKIADGDLQELTFASAADVVYYVKDGAVFVNNGSEKKITDADGPVSSFVVSADGSAAAWIVTDENEIEEDEENYIRRYKTYTYGYKGGKAEKLPSVNTLYSISNGGGIIYAQSKSEKLAVCKGFKDEFESIRGCSTATGISFDGSQILFYDSANGKTYLYNTSLKDPIQVCSDYVYEYHRGDEYFTSSNFDNFIGLTNNGLYRFQRKGEEYTRSKIVSGEGITDLQISEDGKTVVYLKNNKIYKKDTTNENAEAVIIAKDAVSFLADLSLKNVYYKSTDKTLRYTSGDENKTKAITTDNVEDYVMNRSGACTFIYSEALYYSKNGGDRQKISEVKDVKDIYDIHFAVDGDDIYFITANGSNYVNTKLEK